MTGHTQVWCRLGDTVIVVWSGILKISRLEGFVKECGMLSNRAIYTASEFTISNVTEYCGGYFTYVISKSTCSAVS